MARMTSPRCSPGGGGGAVRVDAVQQDPDIALDAQCQPFGGRQIVGFEAHPAAHDAAMQLEFFDDAAHQVYRDRKTDALGARVLLQHGGIDADQFAANIDQCTAGVSGIDGRVRLDVVFERLQINFAATRGADDALRNRFAQAVGIADREHDVADPQLAGTAQRNRRNRPHVDLEQGQIGFGIDADDLGFGEASVAELDIDFG